MEKEYLLIQLFACHYLADFSHFSNDWMLAAKKIGKPLFPIFCHAGIHAILMAIVLMLYGLSLDLISVLSVLQLYTHFFIDLGKGKMNYYFPSLQSPSNKWHWFVFGLDQFLHTIVILLMAFIAVLNK